MPVGAPADTFSLFLLLLFLLIIYQYNTKFPVFV